GLRTCQAVRSTVRVLAMQRRMISVRLPSCYPTFGGVMRISAVARLAFMLLAFAAPATGQNYKGHGIAMHGDLKYGPDFTHFDYTNPDAPKGGELRRYGVGTFDSFNPFIIKGNPDIGSTQVYDTLLAASADEPFSEYGLLAESVETPPDRSWVIFTLRPQA